MYRKEVYGKHTVSTDQPYTKTNKTEMFMVYTNLIPGATYRWWLQTTANNARPSETVTLTMGKSALLISSVFTRKRSLE